MKTEYLVVALGVVAVMADDEYALRQDSETWNYLRSTVYRIQSKIEEEAENMVKDASHVA